MRDVAPSHDNGACRCYDLRVMRSKILVLRVPRRRRKPRVGRLTLPRRKERPSAPEVPAPEAPDLEAPAPEVRDGR